MCEMTREISCKALRYSNVVLEELLGATGELTVVKDEEGGICEKFSLQNQHQHSGDPNPSTPVQLPCSSRPDLAGA